VSKNKRQAAVAPDPFAEMLSGLWAALADGDVLRAEIETARCCSIPHQLGIDQDKSDTIFIGMAKQGGRPEDAALLRLIMLMGSPAIKRQARAALGELTARGVYPASWVTEAGKAEPVRAIRVYDRFGDYELILVTFRYSAGEHTLVARIDLTDRPAVLGLLLFDDGEPELPGVGPFEATEEISLTGARTHLESALNDADSTASTIDPELVALMPIAKSRLRRLPADAEPGKNPLYTSEQRAALVREFLASPYAAQAVAQDEASTRFWAEIATAWSSRVPGHPPLQAGPRTLRYLLKRYVPATYPVTVEQRAQMADAVTAWARWSAAQRDLDEERMLSLLPGTLADFPLSYDDEDAAGRRLYLADVVTSDADVAGLRAVWDARTIAIPPGEEREGQDDDLAALDASDPDDRAAYLAADFAECKVPDGLSRDEFLGVVRRVAEELWTGEPASTREQAQALLAQDDLDRHDIMHVLVRHALSRES